MMLIQIYIYRDRIYTHTMVCLASDLVFNNKNIVNVNTIKFNNGSVNQYRNFNGLVNPKPSDVNSLSSIQNNDTIEKSIWILNEKYNNTLKTGYVTNGNNYAISQDSQNKLYLTLDVPRVVNTALSSVYRSYIGGSKKSGINFFEPHNSQDGRFYVEINRATRFGVIHLDFIYVSGGYICDLPNGVRTTSLIEVECAGSNNAFASCWVVANGATVECRGLVRNRRYIINLWGYFNITV